MVSHIDGSIKKDRWIQLRTNFNPGSDIFSTIFQIIANFSIVIKGFLKTILVDHFSTSGTCYGYSSYKRKRKDDRNTYLFNLPRSNLNHVCDFSC